MSNEEMIRLWQDCHQLRTSSGLLTCYLRLKVNLKQGHVEIINDTYLNGNPILCFRIETLLANLLEATKSRETARFNHSFLDIPTEPLSGSRIWFMVCSDWLDELQQFMATRAET